MNYTGGTVAIPASGLLVRVAVLQDAITEGSETLTLRATNTAGTPATATGTIRDDGQGSIFLAGNNSFTANVADDEGMPTYLDDDRDLSVNSIVVNEASPFAVFTVTGNVDQVISLALNQGSATSGQDYGPGLEIYVNNAWQAYTPGTAHTMTGASLLVRTPILQDDVFEGQEAFSLGVTRLASNTTIYGTASIYDDGTGTKFTGAVDGGNPVTEATNLDDDRTISIDSPNVNEASTYAIFTLTGNSGQTVTLALENQTATINEAQTLQIWDGQDWVDYSTEAALPTFDGNGKIFVRVDISAEHDNVYEGAETFVLRATLSGSSTIVTGTATIRDDGAGVRYPGTFSDGALVTDSTGLDDDRPTVQSVGNVTVTEGQAAVFTVTLSNASNLAQTFNLALADGTATLGADYTAALDFSNGVTISNGVITVPANITTFTVTVPTVDDTAIEETETFTLTIGGVAATGTILDNDAAGIGSVGDVSVTEGQAAVFTVTLSSASNQPETFALSLAGVSATLGADFTAAMTFSGEVTYNSEAGTITVPAGVTSFTVTVPTIDDDTVEATETFTLTVGGVAATGTILDNDAPTIGPINAVTVTEGQAAVFTVNLSTAPSAPTTYPLVLAGGTATLGTDFTAALTFSNGVTYNSETGQITVPAGVTSFTVTVPTVDDATVEATETFTLTVGGIAATGTILDNDVAPTPPPPAPPAPAPAPAPTPAPAPAAITMPVTQIAPAPVASAVIVDSSPAAAPVESPAQPPSRLSADTGFRVRVEEVAGRTGDHELRVDKAIPEVLVPAGMATIQYVIPTDAFVHTDSTAQVDLAAMMLDGSELPPWMSFDATKGEFTGVPPEGYQGDLQIKVVARDENGRQAETIVRIRVGERSALMGKPGLSAQLQEAGVFAWKAERDELIRQVRAMEAAKPIGMVA